MAGAKHRLPARVCNGLPFLQHAKKISTCDYITAFGEEQTRRLAIDIYIKKQDSGKY